MRVTAIILRRSANEVPAGTGAVEVPVLPTIDPWGGVRWDPMSMLFFVPAALLGQALGHEARANEILFQYQWLSRSSWRTVCPLNALARLRQQQRRR